MCIHLLHVQSADTNTCPQQMSWPRIKAFHVKHLDNVTNESGSPAAEKVPKLEVFG